MEFFGRNWTLLYGNEVKIMENMWDKQTETGKSSFLFIDIKVLTTAIQWNSGLIGV